MMINLAKKIIDFIVNVYHFGEISLKKNNKNDNFF